MCWLYLVLKVFSVSPMYSAESIEALYMTDSVRHLFSTGHFVISLQLHCFSLVLVVSFARISFIVFRHDPFHVLCAGI